MILSYNGKAKIKFQLWFNNYKSKQPIFSKKKTEFTTKVFSFTLCPKLPHAMVLIIGKSFYLRSVKRKQPKGRETFWQHKMKTIYPPASSK